MITTSGGSWNNNQRNARSANRNNNNPDNRNNNVGFRCAWPQHFQKKKRILQARVLVFKETKSALEGSPDQTTWSFASAKDRRASLTPFISRNPLDERDRWGFFEICV
ncbi:MAG: SUMF1/EgtB/PvdO family nonheme iron enzyme [bacterium]